jgi:vacuole morphology and inheritance protein 14
LLYLLYWEKSANADAIPDAAFAPLRLELLSPHEHPFLVKSLYAILMLLPQSEAFEILRKRLESVPTLALLALSLPQS